MPWFGGRNPGEDIFVLLESLSEEDRVLFFRALGERWCLECGSDEGKQCCCTREE